MIFCFVKRALKNIFRGGSILLNVFSSKSSKQSYTVIYFIHALFFYYTIINIFFVSFASCSTFITVQITWLLSPFLLFWFCTKRTKWNPIIDHTFLVYCLRKYFNSTVVYQRNARCRSRPRVQSCSLLTKNQKLLLHSRRRRSEAACAFRRGWVRKPIRLNGGP